MSHPTESDYQNSYTILGVFPDDDWETIRNAYKRQIRRWHPDRFQDPEQQQIAENKSKEINLAFQMLDQHYRQYGVLPGTESSFSDSVTVEDSPRPEHERFADREHSQVFNQEVRDDVHVDSGLVQQPKSRSYSGIIVAAVVISVGYFIIGTPVFDSPTSSVKVSQDQHDAWEKATEVENLQPAEPPDATGYSENKPYSKPTKDDSRDQIAVTGADNKPYISRGASKQHVLAIQGRPLRETDDAWDYGLSQIQFRNGKVVDWYENPMNPLNVER